MLNSDNSIKPEYQIAISKVLHYINQNLSGDLSLETISAKANYSPFHFQKIFSSAINESPKQYVMRLRLERAAHYLKVFSNLPVVEIATGCGFSSPSIFSRAFKNYYSVTAEDFRTMTLKETSEIVSKINSQLNIDILQALMNEINAQVEMPGNVQINPAPTVKVQNSSRFACVTTTLKHPDSISFAFKSLMRWATSNEIVVANSRFVGVWLDVPFYTSMDKCRYLAGIEVKGELKFKKNVDIITLEEGKYAGFSMVGGLESTLNHVIALNHHYLEEMGFEMSELICYELFDECPASSSYDKIIKHIQIPVKKK
ncbi:MAG: AraC family transcriptional regulator [Bacteroidota bacterium]